MTQYTKTELERLILEEKRSYEAIGRIYGISGNAIKKAAVKYGIVLPSKRAINPEEIFSHAGFKKASKVNIVDDETFIDIIAKSSTWKEIGEKLGYAKRINSCIKKAIFNRCSILGINVNLKFKTNREILEKKKGDLFKDRKNWQSARSTIQKLARAYYRSVFPNAKCAICGYSHHVEVAHIKAVAEFDDNATVQEINSIDNLIGLCPNHHWEYDNGLLSIKDSLLQQTKESVL
jgi:hypothetical protein